MASDIAQVRLRFNEGVAPVLASQLKAPPRGDGVSERFAWFEDDEDVVIIAGPSERAGRGVDLALAYGLELVQARRLTLCLPEDGAASTLQRAAFMKRDSAPRVFTHDSRTVSPVKIPSRKAAIERVTGQLKPGSDRAEEMRVASTPKYLRGASSSLQALLDHATRHPQLDGGHRKGERNWLCRGQRVLSIQSSGQGLRIRAGIHGNEDKGWMTIAPGEALSATQLGILKRKLDDGIEQRLVSGGKYHKPDEHWFQSVLRSQPWLVGLEHPVLREVPAWRPLADYNKWSRSFIDLVGVDGLGDVHIVETKISSNIDDLFVFQGLDYFVWSLAYKDWLVQRLATSRRVADPTVEFVVGADVEGHSHISKRVPAHLAAIDIPWKFRTINRWFSEQHPNLNAEAQVLPAGELPV